MKHNFYLKSLQFEETKLLYVPVEYSRQSPVPAEKTPHVPETEKDLHADLHDEDLHEDLRANSELTRLRKVLQTTTKLPNVHWKVRYVTHVLL